MKTSENPRVLIAEDDSDIAELLQFGLGSQGLEVTLAGDGVRALELLGQKTPDVLLTDLDMPRKDGITLIKEIREREDADNTHRHILILAMSAGGKEKHRTAEKAGAAFCFGKPFDLARVVEKIKELLHMPLTTGSFQPA